ncbi:MULTISPECIES: TetR/AcrR family transcriptional regulator [unclassified Streptomyces]|uniref:TetR/AcrR family transcriptional regulator n=1 Tax=unclassified Streptomyces TaxID=2593676 RepID=UPI000DB98FF6|nr:MULTISPECIES: TetR/AcrR family transcriptional regulator [unclassified Streptomyces]MYT72356.1 TetR family transcriptional regulator [Streptomyces sp. SID8367]RAJ81772.1 TetR family transcriptional regulator [Streptomyces sp. PsTaAH-137]
MAEQVAGARRGTVEKRQALLRGARTVFGREGYARAGIDEIAAEAGVSTRTLYNHFGGKENLFRETLLDSAATVTAAHVTLIERHLGKVTDIEADLRALAREWMGRRGEHADHMLLVRQVVAEGPHLPGDVVDAWQRTGPLAVREAVREAFVRLGAEGLLAVDEGNSGEAARYFTLLIAGSVTVDTFFGAVPMGGDEIDARVESGVRVFLRLFAGSGDAGSR